MNEQETPNQNTHADRQTHVGKIENEGPAYAAKTDFESHARIMNVREMQNAAKNVERFIEIEPAFDRQLGKLIRNQDEQGEDVNGHVYGVVNVGRFASWPVNRVLKSHQHGVKQRSNMS